MYEWHGSRYLGAAHGLVGICHTLLLCPRTVRLDSELSGAPLHCISA